MADILKTLPLQRSSIQSAHELIKPYIHLTPVLTSNTISTLASAPQSVKALTDTPYDGRAPEHPHMNLFFKCENLQRVGAFKARGAFHALLRLSDEDRSRGVMTTSSGMIAISIRSPTFILCEANNWCPSIGNHAQALALAARTLGVRAYVVMPSIATPSKIEATKGYGAEVIFSGVTSRERDAVAEEVMKRTGAVFIPPDFLPDVILGQGTTALELEAQVQEMIANDKTLSIHHKLIDTNVKHQINSVANPDRSVNKPPGRLDAVIVPLGGGGLLSGIATAFHNTGTLVFGAEPSFQGADDGRRGLATGKRITHVNSLTIADGLRTHMKEIPWSIISDPEKVRAVYAVTEAQILSAMQLVLERMKLVVEPSGVVALAACLYNEDFRKLVQEEGGREGWDVGVIFSGGNTSISAITKMFHVE